tara:strand:- start:327 stop:932 length:606 start_codon:yes stop_codon:yes gene_type:complete
MEVQAHGNVYEDCVIRERTDMSKDEYDALKPNGYTSEFDLSKGLVVDYNGSIKTTKNNNICCSDVVRKMTHTNYRLIVGQYAQVGEEKVFHTEYEFFITPDDDKVLWGKMDIQEVREFVDYVKSIPSGKEAQLSTKSQRQVLQEQAQDSSALFKLNPKVDSKNQRRVQCSLHIDKLIAAGVKYIKKDINYIVISAPRKFNK